MNSHKAMDISPKERSIRRIPISKHKPRKTTERDIPPKEDKPSAPKKKRRFSKIFWIILGLVLIFIALSTVFASGKVEVTPNNEAVIFDSEITTTADSEELSFEIMTLEESFGEEVRATGEEKVEERASGTIVVYNNYSSESQRLIKNTRFETPEGLVYRIPESIVVPGQKTVDGKKVAGSIEVKVFADAPGEKYNIDLTDFTVPGFKGDPRYDSFYGRSKTKMTGGFIGLKKTVSDDDLVKAKETLREELRAALFTKASGSKPEGFTLFNDSIFIEFEDLPQESQGDEVLVRQKGTLYGVLFRKDQLSSYIAEKTLAGYEGEEVLINNFEKLDFTTLEKEESRPWETGEISFILVGNPIIVWQFDEEKLKSELAGKLKKESRGILATYPSIERAEITVRPFWKRSFPKDPEKVKIIQNLPENGNIE